MDNFEKKRINTEESIYKNTWYDWRNCLISYIPEHIKNVSGVKNQIMSLFKSKDYNKQELVRNVYGGGKKQSEKNIKV